MSDEGPHQDDGRLLRSTFPEIIDRAGERAWRLRLEHGPVSADFEVTAGLRGGGTLTISLDVDPPGAALEISDRELRGIILAMTAALGWSAKTPPAP